MSVRKPTDVLNEASAEAPDTAATKRRLQAMALSVHRFSDVWRRIGTLHTAVSGMSLEAA